MSTAAAVLEPKIRAIAPWFGGKRTMAARIIQELGKHTMYFEPFCGSMAVLLSKPRSRHETVNDLHQDVINLARVLANPMAAAGLHRRLKRTLFHEGLLAEARQVIREPGNTDGEIERAFWFFVLSWMGRNGESGLRTMEQAGRACVRWTANGGDPGTRWVNAVDSIPAFTERLRPVVILDRDALTEVIPKIADHATTAIYVDPPYIAKSDQYMHDFKGKVGLFGDDHVTLAKLLRRFENARVVVSYYDHPRVRELYDGWTFVDCATRKHLSNQSAREEKRVEAPELLIVNGVSHTAAAL